MRMPRPLSLRRRRGAERSVASLVVTFALSGLAALVIVAIAGALLMHRSSIADAEHDATQLTRALAMGIVQPEIGGALVRGDRAAARRLDVLVRGRILRDPVARVKIWTPDGRIVYSDEPRLIGDRFRLEPEQREVLATGRAAAELSDLSRPEHRFESGRGKLLEVYVPITAPGGRKLLYEDYLRFESVAARARHSIAQLLPVLLAALVGLWLLQLPLAVSLARGLRDGQRERENLLLRAIRASDVERRRIAASLHDGPVQDLAGISFSLAAAAQDVDRTDRERLRGLLSRAADGTRESMRQLRSLLVTLHPPALESSGLAPVLVDLAAPLEAKGIEVDLGIGDGVDLRPPQLNLCFRTAQEALRNVLEHADADHVAVQLARTNGQVTLTVRDDGRGFSDAEVERRRREGHLGLSLLEEGAADLGGRLTVESAAGRGTLVRLEVPVR
jgi:two-component system, NarL family, sensor kinase